MRGGGVYTTVSHMDPSFELRKCDEIEHCWLLGCVEGESPASLGLILYSRYLGTTATLADICMRRANGAAMKTTTLRRAKAVVGIPEGRSGARSRLCCCHPYGAVPRGATFCLPGIMGHKKRNTHDHKEKENALGIFFVVPGWQLWIKEKDVVTSIHGSGGARPGS